MPLPRPIVLGNWKMHGLRAEALALAGELADGGREPTATLGVFPPATVLAAVAAQLAGTGILVGGQDCHEQAQGAFTGSLGATMLKDAGAAAVIVGHSERRHGLGESDRRLKAKAEAALANGLLVVLCVGQTEAQWLAGSTLQVLQEQIAGSWPDGATADNLVLAYEPVWAVGTGRTPALRDIEETHAAIRDCLRSQGAAGDAVAVIYGGSVKPDNAREIMAVPGVDGVLVGGASLDAAGFLTIYRAGAGA